MTDDRIIGIIVMAGAICLVSAFKPQILRFLERIGYRGWQ